VAVSHRGRRPDGLRAGTSTRPVASRQTSGDRQQAPEGPVAGWRPGRPGRGLAWLFLRWVEELGFEVGDAAVLEPQVRPCGFQPLVQGPVVIGELTYSLFEGGVLGGDVLDGVLGPLGLKVADLA
jgi:hypothetical protein